MRDASRRSRMQDGGRPELGRVSHSGSRHPGCQSPGTPQGFAGKYGVFRVLSSQKSHAHVAGCRPLNGRSSADLSTYRPEVDVGQWLKMSFTKYSGFMFGFCCDDGDFAGPCPSHDLLRRCSSQSSREPPRCNAAANGSRFQAFRARSRRDLRQRRGFRNPCYEPPLRDHLSRCRVRHCKPEI